MMRRKKEKRTKKIKKARRRSTVGKTVMAALVAMLVMLGGTYAGLAVFFENHYFFNTIINGQNCSYKTAAEVEILLYRQLEEYALAIQGRDGVKETITSAEIDMEYQWDGSLMRMMKGQKPWAWISGFFEEHTYDLYDLITYDKDRLERELEELAFYREENIRPAKDAYIVYSPQKKQYQMMEADAGTELKKDLVREEIIRSLAYLEPEMNLEERGCYLHEKATKKEEGLEVTLQQANQYLSTEINYDWNGNLVVVNEDFIHGWIEIEGEQVRLREDKIREFVEQQAASYDTYGKNRFFQTTDGRRIELNTQACGWQTETETELQELIEAIHKGIETEKQPAHTYIEPASWQVEIVNSYVEMDLTAQKLYLYVDGVMLLESDFVSGNIARGWTTPAGVFGLTYKTRNAVLRGENYATPVSYWMPFNGNIGMHDATWRGSFGGEIYRTNGSHGCINLPYEKAKIIYEYMYTGFPIVCYY